MGVPQKRGGSAAVGAGGISWSEDRRRAAIDPALVVVRLARPELIEACLGHVSPGRRHNSGVVNGEGAGIAGRAQRSRAPDDEQGRSVPESGVQDGRRQLGQVALVTCGRTQCDHSGVTVFQETGHALAVSHAWQRRAEAGAEPLCRPPCPDCVSGWWASEGRAVALWRFEAKMSAPADNGSAPRVLRGGASWGLNLIQVCARWCPTLPHPGGCSTIGAVRLSFRVRDGYRAFPCRCDHRDDYMGSAGPSSLVRLFGYPCDCLPPHMRVWLVAWVGCGPYSGRSRLPLSLTPRRYSHAH